MKRTLFILAFFALTLSINAQERGYEAMQFTSSKGTTLNCRTLEPDNIKEGEKYPLVVFMHGAGERGDDNEKQLVHGSGMFLNPANQAQYPTFAVFPQCPEDKYWAFESRPENFDLSNFPKQSEPTLLIEAVRELIDEYLKDSRVDRNRVYIIGLSTGAMATYDMVARYPELFAAAVPICGMVDSERLENRYATEFWIFHGDSDSVVPVEGSRGAYRALCGSGNSPRYTEFAGCDHASWNLAFNQRDFMSWLFSQQL